MNTLITKNKEGSVEAFISLPDAEAYPIIDEICRGHNNVVHFVLLDYSGDIITQGGRT